MDLSCVRRGSGCLRTVLADTSLNQASCCHWGSGPGGLEYKQNTCWWSDSACLYCKCPIVVFYWQGSLCPSPSPLSSPRSPSLLSITPYHSVRFVCQDNIRNSKNHSAGRSSTGMSAFRSWVSSCARLWEQICQPSQRHLESFLFSLAKDNVPDWDIWKKTVC